MHAGEVGTREADGIMNMCAAEELAYGIAWVEKKRKRSSRTSCAEACVGFSASQFNLVRALDGQLQWGGLAGLAAFSPLPEHCRILKATEYRYFVECAPWDGYPAAEWRRSVVKDFATGKKRYEVPVGAQSPSRSVLAQFADECASQLSLQQGLAHGAHIRIIFLKDVFHRYWRDVLNALSDAGLMSMVFEALHVMNIPHGPWKSGKWWREMQESMDKHFRRNTHENPLFQAMLPELQREMQRYGRGFRLTAEPDTHAAQRQVWRWLKRVGFLRRKYWFVKLKTWWEFSNA